jgi:hypothetical protein
MKKLQFYTLRKEGWTYIFMTNFTLGMKDLLVAVSMIWRTSLNRELSSKPMNTTLCEQPRTDEQKPLQHHDQKVVQQSFFSTKALTKERKIHSCYFLAVTHCTLSRKEPIAS